MDLFYRREKEKEDGYNEKQCLKMFGCSKSGYHAWLTRMKDEDGKRAAKLAEEQEIMECFRKIIAKYDKQWETIATLSAKQISNTEH